MNPKQCEKILKALANKRRLEIIKCLMEKKRATVGEIAHSIKLSFKSTSRHLSILFSIDILEREYNRLSVFYSFSSALPSLVKKILSEL